MYSTVNFVLKYIILKLYAVQKTSTVESVSAEEIFLMVRVIYDQPVPWLFN